MDPRLTFWLKVMIAFFIASALRKSAMLAGLVVAGLSPGDPRHLVDRFLPLAVGILFDALLAAQLYLRARSGRFWGTIYLAAQGALGLFVIVVEPARLLELGPLGRGRELLTCALQFAFLAHLAGRRSGRILTR